MKELTPYDFLIGERGASTTPAENTPRNGQRLLVDWVSASFYFAKDVQELLHLIGIKEHSYLSVAEGSRYQVAGYNKTYNLGFLEIMHNEHDHVYLLNFSGQGCRQYELSSTYTITQLLAILLHYQATFNRLDIAIDDFDNIYNVNTIRKAVYEKRCVTRLRTWGNHERGYINSGNDVLTMDNFYIGSQNSRYFLNIYDKKLERQAKNIDVINKTWTRTEIRLKEEYALKMAEELVSSKEIGRVVKGFLKDKFTFLTPTAVKSSKNKSRLAKDNKNIARWWLKFIGRVEKLNISVDIPERTLEESKEWLFKQVATTLAMLEKYDEDNYYNLINDLTQYGKAKMQEKHYNKVENQKYIDKQRKKRYRSASII